MALRIITADERQAEARGIKAVIFVGILDEKLDDFNRRVFVPQIDGSKTGLELPGIVDQVMTLAEIKTEVPPGQPAVAPFRGLVCQTINPWGYPAKDRSGRLEMLEPPHLGQLFLKIRTPSVPIDARGLPPFALPAPSTIPNT